MRLLLYIVFILSGAAGLMYEMVWSRYLALFLGHSAYAQILVIAIFLGGMALGALLAGRYSERWSDPLKWYVGAELVVGLMGLFFHEIYQATTQLAYTSIFPALAGSLFLGLFKWTLAAALILPQSILLGATFPLMAAGLLRRPKTLPGRTLSALYFTNSLGAAAGVLLAGFYLIYSVGLPGTLLFAAMTNLIVALVTAITISRYPGATAPRPQVPREAAIPEEAHLSLGLLTRLLLGVSFGTAVASFAYEIGWLRMLSLVLGSATHSFELMLSAFILGLALGALWVRRRADEWRKPLRALGFVQLAMGISALATLSLYGASFYWMRSLLQTFAPSAEGYTAFTLARYGISLAIMFPASFCAGMTLPLITRTLLVNGAGERSIGTVYGVNTFGAIVGVAAAGFLFMPLVGLKGVIIGGATLDMALGVAVLHVAAGRNAFSRRLVRVGLAVTIVLFGAATLLGRGSFDTRLLASGVYRTGVIPEPGEREYLFHKDGRTATVTVERNLESGNLIIRTNGKPDASLDPGWLESCTDSTIRGPLLGDASTQALAPLITLAHAPDARIAGVIGHGSGMSSHFLLGAPGIESLVTVEIEPEMVEGSRAFYPGNQRVFDDPRSLIVIDDAKTYFASRRLEYDLIFSEPSNPWVSGIASLFGKEFYSHIRRYLAEGGVFGQWLHLYEIDDGLVLSILAAIHENFRSYEIFLTWSGDMLIVASGAPTMPEPDWSIFDSPALRESFCRILPLTPDALEALRLTHRAALAPLLDSWEATNSDFYPIVDLMAERARYQHSSATGFQALPTSSFDFTAPFFGRRSSPGLTAPVPFPSIPRLNALALSAALREATAAGFPPAAIRYRHAQWRALLDSDQEQSEWKAWLSNFRTIERDLHRGTAGFADERFFEESRAYMLRHDAADVVRQAVSFRHGLDSWDFDQAAEAARALLVEEAYKKGFIPADELLDGGVVALLLMGDVQAAANLYDEVRPASRRGPADLQLRLLRAYLDVAIRNQ